MRAARFVIPFGLSAALFAGVLALLIMHGLHQNAGVFVYPLDDAYIHLAVSRNLTLHGVWGISPNAFSGASSSPGWTLLLAAVTRIAGVHVLTPLLLNILAAISLLALANILLVRSLPGVGALYLTLALCALVLIVPLPGLALIGMEHVLHSAAILCLVVSAARILSLPRDSVPRPLSVATLVCSSFAGGVLRYESCFAVGVIVILLIIRRRTALALLAAAAASIGPLAYALYSYAHTGILLPFSVVMKSSIHTDHHVLDALMSSDVSPVFLPLAVVLLVRMAQRAAKPAASRNPFWTFGNSFLVIALATTILHAEAGPIGWLMRYEAYLYVLDLLALTIALLEQPALITRHFARSQRWIAAALLVALAPAAVDLLHRAHHGYSDLAESLHDRYVEHLSQALFVQAEMPHAAVLANDIGFLAFYANQATILDPLGLGSIEPVQLVRRHQQINPDFVERWADGEHASLAILHTDFPGMAHLIPPHWVLVESWCFPHNLVFQNHVESFYAPDAASAATLRSDMSGFHNLSPEITRYHFPQDGSVPPDPPRGETAACPIPRSEINSDSGL